MKKKKEELTKTRVFSLVTDTLVKDHQGKPTIKEGNTTASSPRIARSIGTFFDALNFTA